jgi:hypothetical protein
MQAIPIKNETLKDIINTFLEVMLSVNRDSFPYGPKGKPQENKRATPEYACSNEYLEYMQNKKVDGFPEITFGCDLGQWMPPQQELQLALKKLDTDLLAWSGSRNNAVKMLYPKGGYMGWHHNANASGYNILLSWSKDGTGYFRYQDPVTKEIVTMKDTPGWTCKVGYYGKTTEPDRIYWHCANAQHEERFTLGYIIPHLGMWEDMCADIQSI